MVVFVQHVDKIQKMTILGFIFFNPLQPVDAYRFGTSKNKVIIRTLLNITIITSMRVRVGILTSFLHFV